MRTSIGRRVTPLHNLGFWHTCAVGGRGGGRSSELCLCDIYSLCVFTVLISLQRTSKEKKIKKITGLLPALAIFLPCVIGSKLFCVFFVKRVRLFKNKI